MSRFVRDSVAFALIAGASMALFTLAMDRWLAPWIVRIQEWLTSGR